MHKVETHGFFPHNQGLTSSTPYPSEPCPFSFNIALPQLVVVLVLIDVRVYMMPNYNVLNGTINHRQLSPLLRYTHNQIDGGGFSLSSSPRSITIYTSCKRGQNRGHYKYNHRLRSIKLVRFQGRGNPCTTVETQFWKLPKRDILGETAFLSQVLRTEL